jgi:hypothetical protein
MMPAMAAAYQTLSRDRVPRASTAINIVQRVGGSMGTALMAVVLEHQISIQVHGGGGLSAVSTASPVERARNAQSLSVAFGHTFWWALGLTAVALVPALLLPRRPMAGEVRPEEDEALLVE